ncbi:MAG: hypothetical protein QW086_10025 [Pyrobaculum sp.]
MAVVCRSVIVIFVCGYVGVLCTVMWRGEKYRVECSPSFLLSVASKIAENEHISYLDVYKQIVESLEGEYRNTRRVVNALLLEKRV